MDCFVNLGQFRHSHQRKKKTLEASGETSERIYACCKAVTETPGKQLGSTGSWLLLLRGEPDLEPAQPEPAERAANERRVQHLPPPSPCLHGAIPARSSLAHTWLRVRKDIHLLTKGEKKKKRQHKKQLQVLIQHRLEPSLFELPIIRRKTMTFPFH